MQHKKIPEMHVNSEKNQIVLPFCGANIWQNLHSVRLTD